MSIIIQLSHFVLRTNFTHHRELYTNLTLPPQTLNKHFTSLMLFMLKALVLMEVERSW